MFRSHLVASRATDSLRLFMFSSRRAFFRSRMSAVRRRTSSDNKWRSYYDILISGVSQSSTVEHTNSPGIFAFLVIPSYYGIFYIPSMVSMCPGTKSGIFSRPEKSRKQKRHITIQLDSESYVAAVSCKYHWKDHLVGITNTTYCRLFPFPHC